MLKLWFAKHVLNIAPIIVFLFGVLLISRIDRLDPDRIGKMLCIALGAAILGMLPVRMSDHIHQEHTDRTYGNK